MTKNHSDEELELKRNADSIVRTISEIAEMRGRSFGDLVHWQDDHELTPEAYGVLSSVLTDVQTLLDDIENVYQKFVASDSNATIVTVTTAVDMGDELRAKVQEKIDGIVGSKAYMVERVDPSIIGGIVVEVGGRRYDASVRAQLAHIREELFSTVVGGEAR